MDIRRIQWQETIALRQKVLWPDKPPEFCHAEGDESAWHFGAFLANELVSVASVYPEGKVARLRKFATATTHQGRGIGTEMLKHILSDAAHRGIDQFWCDARESAMGFYLRFGMQVEGDQFYKSTVPYRKMAIRLALAQF